VLKIDSVPTLSLEKSDLFMRRRSTYDDVEALTELKLDISLLNELELRKSMSDRAG
jgi:hypothetical protein